MGAKAEGVGARHVPKCEVIVQIGEKIQLAMAVVLLLASGFFASSETALFTLSPIHMNRFGEKKRKLVEILVSDPPKLLFTILLGNEIINVMFSTITGGLLSFHGANHLISILITTLLLLTFGEISPKTTAVRHPVGVSKIVAGPLLAFSKFASPARSAVQAIGNFLGITPLKPKPKQIDEEKFRLLVEAGAHTGVLEDYESEMIAKVFDLDTMPVHHIMTPRTEIFALSANLRLFEAASMLSKNPHARVPVIEEADLDKVIGVLYAVDLLRNQGKKPEPAINSIMRPPLFVPRQKTVADLFWHMRLKRTHFAIVVDEFGGVSGLVTMDDVLREIFGEIRDEHDKQDWEFSKLADGSYLFAGRIDLETAMRLLDIEMMTKDYETIAGMVLDLAGHLPEERESVSFGGWSFSVIKLDGARIQTIKASREPQIYDEDSEQ